MQRDVTIHITLHADGEQVTLVVAPHDVYIPVQITVRPLPVVIDLNAPVEGDRVRLDLDSARPHPNITIGVGITSRRVDDDAPIVVKPAQQVDKRLFACLFGDGDVASE